MMWIGIVGIIMFFAGLTSAYVVRQAQGDWLYFDVPEIFYFSTAIILVSSLTMFLAQWLAKKGSMKASAGTLTLTTILGVAFLVTQYEGFLDLVENGIYFTGVKLIFYADSMFYINVIFHRCIDQMFICLGVETNKVYVSAASAPRFTL